MKRDRDAKETIRLRILEWQVGGWARVPALTGAEQLLADLERDGLKIVPVEPTREMWAAGANAVVGKTTVHHDQVVGAAWPAMIAAA